MNALIMKLENRQQTVKSEDKFKDLNDGQKKCKSVRIKDILTTDKDALLNSNGLRRKFCDDFDVNNIETNVANHHDTSKKNRSKKASLKGDKMFTETDRIQERLQRSLSPEDKEKILCILNEIRALSDVEKLFLYLQLPTGSPFEVDPFKQKSLNPLGKKADEEGMFAVTWIQSHLEEDPDVSLPKQEVYDEYQLYCNLTGSDPLCAADFGKVMKQIFPSVKPRRLGTRGNSRYCYSGLRKKSKLAAPTIPDIQKDKENSVSEESFGDEVTAAACHLLFEWAEKLLGIKFSSLKELAVHLLENMYVDNRSVAAFTVLLDGSPQLLSKGCVANEGGVKKSEAQFHLQRKIQEKELIKEQKRKLQQQRTHIVSATRKKGVTGAKKKNVKSRKAALEDEMACAEICKDSDSSKNEETVLQVLKSEMVSDTPSTVLISEADIKKEDFSATIEKDVVPVDEQAPSIALVSPLSSPNSSLGEIEDSSKKKCRTLISQNKSPVCIAQSLPGIIIVPSLPQISADIGKQNSNPPKYKRIQPKPLQGELLFSSVARSRSGSVGSSFPSKPKSRNADGRRSSHACLQSDCLVENVEGKLQNSAVSEMGSQRNVKEKLQYGLEFTKDVEFERDKSVLDHGGNNGHATLEKRKKIHELHVKPRLFIQSGVHASDLSEDNSSVKRHLEENDHVDNKRVHLEISTQPSWIQANTADLNQPAEISHDEVNVHEIEGDALNDYFRSASTNNSVNPIQHNELELQLSSSNKVQQLSQLRMLLEQNLPSAISKTNMSSVNSQKISKVIDISESDICSSPKYSKKGHNIASSNTLVSKTVFDNPADSSSNTVKSDPQLDSLETLLSSSYLTANTVANLDSQLLSDSDMLLNCSQNNSIQNIDVSLQQEFSQNAASEAILLSSSLLSDVKLMNEQMSTSASYNRVSTCTQVPSVPQSPNTRRRAFNFMPISPRHTPVPDGIISNGMPSVSSPHLRTMMSTGVGPSQPPSNSGSPFVSPRSTPVPLCRSRHSSGQSTYSTSRHTPFQNFDSGVSSVSSSPFISPQPTPVPVSRLRHNSNHGSSKTVTFCSLNSAQVINLHSASNNTRTRHSSGPGAPHVVTSPRSSSLSPLVTEQMSVQSFVFPPNNEIRSRHNSGSNATTPLSPVSEQASSSSSCASNMPDLTGVNDMTLPASHSFLNDGAGDILISANPSSFKQVRHRHASSSVLYGKSSYNQRDLFSQEIQKLLKNSQDNSTSDLLLSNRSQSVPLHQMLQTADGLCFLTQPVTDLSCPKSHPTTPTMNQIFSFPSTLEASTLSLGMDVSNQDKSIIQNAAMEWTGFDNSTELESSGARRNLSALYDTVPLGDDLQTTLEDLRDCDTDFSKLELELRQCEDSSL